jgi:hypothetical protein
MTKNELDRVLAWRLKLLREANDRHGSKLDLFQRGTLFLAVRDRNRAGFNSNPTYVSPD